MLGLGSSLSHICEKEQLYSITYDGTGDYIALPAAIGRTTGSMSIWYKTSETGNQVLIGAGDKDDGTNRWSILLGNALTSSYTDEVMELNITIDNVRIIQATYRSATATLFRDGNWHHMVLTMSGSANLMYVDGTVLASGSGQEKLNYQQGATSTGNVLLTTSGLDSIGIGRRFFPTSPLNFTGNTTEFAMWESVLDADAVTAIYNSGKPFDLTNNRGNYDVAADLLYYYRMNDGSGTTVVDSKADQDGTLSADATFSANTPDD